MSVPTRVLAMVLAGGEGKRLVPLTADRAKPAVPFGGNYRLIDFALSNLVNGGFLRIVVLTQYKSHSLDRHISQTWRLSPMLGNYVATVPAQMRRGPHWFSGSADAIFQNLNLITDERPDYILVFGADHIYRMDPRQMVDQHIESGAGVTVAGIPFPIEQAGSLGVIETADGQRISRFREKPSDPVGLPNDPERILASMGNYVFTTAALVEAVTSDASNPASKHDVGGDLIPMMVGKGDAWVYDFETNKLPGATSGDKRYWRDVGDLDSYYEANMDLVSVTPSFNLYNKLWPVYSYHETLPPAKLIFDEDSRRGQALDSMLSAGVVVSGGTVRHSVLSPEVVVESNALVEQSVLMHGVCIGERAVVRRAIIDKNVQVPPGAQIGVDLEGDRRRFKVSDKGITVIGKNQTVEPS
ncbi:MAG: glucose-1-phosphate adenylyltransferase [Actinomycetota bacterium]